MYAILPAFVSAIFLGFGLYVLVTKGVTRISTSFFLLCVTTFAWQGTWAFLFQAEQPDVALLLAKVGYLFIIFLPTCFYHFVTEVTECRTERPPLLFSYGLSLVLAVMVLTGGEVVSGVYIYFFGEYPKAGRLHPLHVAQTVLLACRSGWLLLAARRNATGEKRKRLDLCLVSLCLYSLAAVDYAANYGYAFYPPGVIFIGVSLGILAVTIVRYDLMHPFSLAATVAHEVRTPLTTIRLQADEIGRAWPDLLAGYQLAVAHGLCKDRMRPGQLDRAAGLVASIQREIDGTHTVIDMALASVTLERLDRHSFTAQSLQHCVVSALERYPFLAGERERVAVGPIDPAWCFRGSDTLLVYVLFNLLKNALQAMRASGDGRIEIGVVQERGCWLLRFSDTGPGISPEILPRIFDPFFSTKAHGNGAGMGLAFCRRVVEAFDGRIQCESVRGVRTTFTLRLPDAHTGKGSAMRARPASQVPASGAEPV
ncbi:sensor histidine kinase [Cupriavidus basilensis]|uniref:histidine kinase n=1 Tax=Cupriavidus basilensis TaxID=68895 RepID=A0A643FKC6_9BURK|nr:sensor histidine kinase [Cupriavidus basilensis]QOT74871.1 GHKL domain-containing protein [Cupriavidus basilensis]